MTMTSLMMRMQMPRRNISLMRKAARRNLRTRGSLMRNTKPLMRKNIQMRSNRTMIG